MHAADPFAQIRAAKRANDMADASSLNRAPAAKAGATTPAASHSGMLTARPGDHLVLMPGELYFGSRAATARTLLGSCVAVTLWHPLRRIGGMCHYLLPSRGSATSAKPEGRYGEEAMAMLVRCLSLANTHPSEYEVHMYGGADTQPGATGRKTLIGERNIELGWGLIDEYGFALQAVDVGENVPRHVQIDLKTGEVNMRRGAAIRSPRQP